MKTSFFLLAFVLSANSAFAQICNCTEQFDWLRQKLALNYPGYRDKVTPQTQANFDLHNADFQAKIASATSDTACLRMLTDWARWFRDGHVQLYAKGSLMPDNPAAIRQRFANWEKIAMTEAEARAYLDQPGRDAAEGIYQIIGGNYRVALVRNATPSRDFAAVILKADSLWWMPGQVKFELKQTEPGKFTSRFFMRDHSERKTEAVLNDKKLEFKDLGAWYKMYPGMAGAIPKEQIFTLEKLDDVTILLTVPTMNESVRLELDSLVKANAALLERTPNLIIDCRNNGGGSDLTFYPLKPYVYTGPVKDFRGQIYATEDNLQKYENLRTNMDFPKKYRRQFGRTAKKMRRNLGEFIGKCGEATDKFRNPKPYPQRVAILINGNCASSCEQFVFYAEQSQRVTLIGQNTAGILDYGNLHNLDFPCGRFGLAYPTSRSCGVSVGKGIDGIGVPPDVRIEDAKTDWVDFARKYLEGK